MRHPKSLIGLDLGTHCIKAVEFTWHNGLVLTGFGAVDVPSPDAVPDALSDLLSAYEFHTRQVVTSVSGRSVIVRYLTMFRMSPDDLRNAIRYEADKYIPFDIDDVIMDCQPFEADGVGDLAQNEMRVLLVACKRAVIDENIRLMASLGLQPAVVDVDVFALGNAYETAVRRGPDEADLVTALVDVGASKTSVNLVRGKTSLFTREIHSGGIAFSNAIAARLHLGTAEAEALKCSPDEDLERVRQAVGPVVDDLASELRLSFEYFENQFEQGIDEVLLSGGGARLNGLSEDFAQFFQRPTAVWDPTGELPIARGRVDTEALREHVQELAVAVGLAARLGRDR